MIGIIAGEIIGSPYKKENIPDINRIFFPLFEDNRVIDPKTYRERSYKAAPGRITDAVLKLSGNSEAFTVSKPDKGEAMCQAIVIGRTDARFKMPFDKHEESVSSFLRFFPESMHNDIVDAADAAYRLERKTGGSLFEQMGQMNPPRPEVTSAMLKGYLLERAYHFNLTGGSVPKVSGVSGRSYRFYAVLNCGDLSSFLSRGDGERKLTSLNLSCPPSTFSLAKGMPMACGPVDAALGTTLALRFTRLPARYDFRVVKNFSHGTFRIKSLRLRQSPTETSPFASKRAFTASEASKMADGDHATDSDISSLESGSFVRFYTLENACGKALNNPTADPKLKVPQSGTSVGGYLPTYIEMIGTYTDLSGGLVSENTYRMYLGDNNYDSFDVRRGTRYILTLNLSDEGGFIDDYWKLEPDVTDSRTFRFASRTYTINGNSSTIVGVTGSSPHHGITYSLDASLSQVSFNPTTRTLSQGKVNTQRSGSLTAYYWDGRIADQCTITAMAYKEPIDVSPIGMVNVRTSWDHQSLAKVHDPACTRDHGAHNPRCTRNHTSPWNDDYIDIDDCPNRIEDIEHCPNYVLELSGAGIVNMSFQIAANYRVSSTGQLVYDILTPGRDYVVESFELLTDDGRDGDDSASYAPAEISGNTVNISCQFQDPNRTHWFIKIIPTGAKLDPLERNYVVANGGSGPINYNEAKVTYPNATLPHTYIPRCSKANWRVWMLSDKSLVEFENTDEPQRKNSFMDNEEMCATVASGKYGRKTKVYAVDMNGNVLKESIFNTDEYTCNVIWHGFFDDPMDASRLEFNFYTGFQECLLPVSVVNEEVVLEAVLDDHPTVYNTTEDRFFDFWTDGYTVAAILYVQELYDTYDWDAEVYVKGVNKHYLNVAPDGSWTLR